MKNFKSFINEASESKKCPDGQYYCFTDKKCKKIPTGYRVGYGGRLAPDNRSDSGNGKNGNGNGNGNGAGAGGNGQNTGETYLAADVRKMPDCGYGGYAVVFKKGKRVMTPGGNHRKELKKVYKNKKDANDYMAAIMIAKGGG